MELKQAAQNKNILVLAANRDIFYSAKNVLEKNGHFVTDDMEAELEFDLVMIDSFFRNSGTADFLDCERPAAPIVLITLGEEKLDGMENEIHDMVLVESLERDHVEEQISSWAATPKSHRLFDRNPVEFGSGLWVEIAQYA